MVGLSRVPNSNSWFTLLGIEFDCCTWYNQTLTFSYMYSVLKILIMCCTNLFLAYPIKVHDSAPLKKNLYGHNNSLCIFFLYCNFAFSTYLVMIYCFMPIVDIATHHNLSIQKFHRFRVNCLTNGLYLVSGFVFTNARAFFFIY